MSTHIDIQSIDNPLLRNGGSTWNRLHTEREEICSLLLDESRELQGIPSGLKELDPNQESARHVQWAQRELLQARLRQLDDALDRLMAGSYGDCSDCGRWIEDTRLDADPALALCIECQQSREGEHHFRTM